MFSQPLAVGSTYRLKFKSVFERHGVCTTAGVTCLHAGGGVFRLQGIMTFQDTVLAGIKLYDNFFKPLGISEADYQAYFSGKPDDEFEPEYTVKQVTNETTEREAYTEDGQLKVRDHKVVTVHEVHEETQRSVLTRHVKDSVQYATYPVYKFVDAVDSNDELYVPELTIDGFPEIDINQYRDLSLVIHLGYLDNPETLDPMLLAIRERMAVFGWRPSLIKLFATDMKWMSPTEYENVKSLRVPANIVSIAEDEKSDYLNKFAIVNGQMKKIVQEVVDPNTQLDIDTIAEHEQFIDRRLFTIKCIYGDRFESGCTYYRLQFWAPDFSTTKTYDVDSYVTYNNKFYRCHTKVETAGAWTGTTNWIAVTKTNTEKWFKLVEDVDFTPGSPCVEYVLATADDEHVQHYRLIPGSYIQVARGTNSNYAADKLFYKETITDTVEGGEPVTTEKYTQATEEQIADESLVLYTRLNDVYEKTTDTTVGETYVLKCGNSTDEVYRLNYATVDALQFLGCRYVYEDKFTNSHTITLQLEDIIDFADYETNVILPAANLGEQYWKPYMGRLFRWKEHTRTTREGLSIEDTLEVIVSENSIPLIAEKIGCICGQTGTISTETYVRDDAQQKRNYYMQYMIQSKIVEQQKVRIAALEKALVDAYNNGGTPPVGS